MREEWKTKLAEMKKNARDLMDDMDAHKKAFKSDMQSLQAGIRAITCRTRQLRVGDREKKIKRGYGDVHEEHRDEGGNG